MSQGTDKPTSPLPPGHNPHARTPRNLQMIIKLGFMMVAAHVLTSCCFQAPQTMQDAAGRAARGTFLKFWVPSNLAVSLAMAAMLLRACLACTRLDPKGRKGLIVYAVAMMCWMACSATAFIFLEGYRRLLSDEALLYLCYVAALLAYPIAALVVMNDLHVRFLFDPPPEAAPATAPAAKIPLFYGPLKPGEAERPAGAIGGTGPTPKKN